MLLFINYGLYEPTIVLGFMFRTVDETRRVDAPQVGLLARITALNAVKRALFAKCQPESTAAYMEIIKAVHIFPVPYAISGDQCR